MREFGKSRKLDNVLYDVEDIKKKITAKIGRAHV